MHIILLSGGSGKRLWPLSNDIRSKQFLKILKDPLEEPESMLQRVYRQLKEIGGWDSITVAAGESQRDQLKLQLGKEVNVVIEPERRDTFPAIALACSYLHSEKDVQRNEVIAVLPVDPFVDATFFKKIAEIEKVYKDAKPDLVLIGSKPTVPTDKYGYIVLDAAETCQTINVHNAKQFKEKPTVAEAKELIEQGALWNCGVFGLTIGYVFDILTQKYNVTDFLYKEMQETFKALNKTSFDYEIVEKAEKINVLKYEGNWKDIGTFLTLTEEMSALCEGNVIIDKESHNTHVINELDVPTVVIGIDNAVVVATHDGILVSHKAETHKVKEMLAKTNNRPMYERKRWGKYKVIEHSGYENGTEALTKKLMIEAGKQLSYQYHEHRKEIWTIISGKGIIYVDGKKSKVQEGDIFHIHENEKHGIFATTHMEIIEVQLGHPLIEDDIVRLEEEWD